MRRAGNERASRDKRVAILFVWMSALMSAAAYREGNRGTKRKIGKEGGRESERERR
jgi:hypothetical protein